MGILHLLENIYERTKTKKGGELRQSEARYVTKNTYVCVYTHIWWWPCENVMTAELFAIRDRRDNWE